MTNCTQCNSEMRYVEEYSSWYCDACQDYQQNMQGAQHPQQQPQQFAQQPQQQPQQQPTGNMTLAQQLYNDKFFTIKQKLLSIAHKYFVTNSQDQLVGFVQQKMFKLKEDIRIYTDDTKATEIMRIQQANILDFSGSFQVMDSQSGEVIGILKRKGLKSMLKDEWKILDPYKNEIGKIKEQGGLIWFIRRFILKFIPYKYFIEIGGVTKGTVKEKFQVIGDTYFIDLSENDGVLDSRLAVAIGLMMDIGEHE